MDISTIMAPIEKDLSAFRNEIDGFVAGVSNEKVRSNYQTFFEKRGKHLRPSLLFMSYNAINKENQKETDYYKLALVLELIHSASLVHDDIIDEDDYRRGNATINHVFGNKVGVLAGDTLFSYAFFLATELFPKDYNKLITKLALSMCMAELEQANEVVSKEAYLSVIKGKTANFMSVSCELGALHGSGTEDELIALREFGLNLGMTYQIVDDFIDGDKNALKYITRDVALIYYNKALKSLDILEESIYKSSLINLLEYVLRMEG